MELLKNAESQPLKRLLIIFEALVPNPKPPQSPVKPRPDNIFVNLAGCRPIVEFWLSLSDPNMSTTDRGTALRHFFLKGLPYADVGPVVDASNYAGGPASGQIRTNQRMEDNWTLREFKTYGGRIVPVTVKSNPGNSLFWKDPRLGKDPREIEFADYLVRKDTLDNLRGVTSSTGNAGETSIDTFAFGLTVPGVDHLNSFESNVGARSDIVTTFDTCRLGCGQVQGSGAESCEESGKACLIEKRINDALKGSLNANNIIHRIQTQTCAGCHHFSNGDTELGVNCPEGWPNTLCGPQGGIWPTSLGFTHVSENAFEAGADSDTFDLATLSAITPEELRKKRCKRISHLNYKGPDGEKGRYKISETLKFLLLPPRFENMVLYLNQFDAPP